MHKMPLVVLAGFFLLAAQSAVAAPHHKDCRPLWHKDRAAFERCVQGDNGQPGSVAPSPGQPAPDGKEQDMRPHNGQPRKDIVSDCTKRWGNDRHKVDACVRDAAANHPKR